MLENYIIKGVNFPKMQENPLNSKDAMHGLPRKWSELLDMITETREEPNFNQDLDQCEQDNIRSVVEHPPPEPQ